MDQGAVNWHTSSYSHEGNMCVEQGRFPSGQVAVRDTKDQGSGPVLAFDPRDWTAFIAALQEGRA